ncbi:MAG: hypothetical protein KDC48_19385, partial [Planctomycetes bacterium]|nr:hypothetical protein [Planctomycetota bacterium]
MTTSATPSPRRRSRRRLVLFVLFAIGLGCVGALLAIELLLRVYDPLPHPLTEIRWLYRVDDQGRIELTPGWQGGQTLEGRRTQISINALGLRGAEIGEKQPGERRVLMLGDSFVFGQGVDDDEAVPARLQHALAKAGRDVVVGNAGMTGTGPREWSYTLTRLRPSFEPDAVVAVVYMGNDVLDTLQEPLSAVSGWLLTPDFARVARRSWRFRLRVASRVWDKVEQALSGVNLFAMAEPRPVGHGVPLGEALFLDRDPARDAEMPFLGEVEAAMGKQFDAFVGAAGPLPTVVVLLPSFAVATRDYQAVIATQNQGVPPERQLDPALLERGRGHARVAAWLAARGLRVVDLGPRILADRERARCYLPHDGHFNPAGCEQVAQWLAQVAAELL